MRASSDHRIHSSNEMTSSFKLTIHNQPTAFQLLAVFNLSFHLMASALSVHTHTHTHAHFKHWSFCYSDLRIFAVFSAAWFVCRAPFRLHRTYIHSHLFNWWMLFALFFNTNSVKRQMLPLSYSKHIPKFMFFFLEGKYTKRYPSSFAPVSDAVWK